MYKTKRAVLVKPARRWPAVNGVSCCTACLMSAI